VVWIPTVEEWPAVVAACPEEVPPDRKIMLHVMLADKLISFAIGLS